MTGKATAEDILRIVMLQQRIDRYVMSAMIRALVPTDSPDHAERVLSTLQTCREGLETVLSTAPSDEAEDLRIGFHHFEKWETEIEHHIEDMLDTMRSDE